MTDRAFLHCPNCEMGFHSRGLLEKHKEKFCIGREKAMEAKHPKRQVVHKGKEPKRTETSESMLQVSKPKPDDFRPSRGIAEPEHERQVHNVRSSDSTGSVSGSQALKKLTEEFHRLRISLEGTLPKVRSFQAENENCHQQQFCQRQRQMVEAHERQLADIQARNQHLEQQKDEIYRRLSELKSGNSSTSYIEQLLMELSSQEEKNKLSLDALKEQVGLLQVAAESRSKLDPATNLQTDNTPNKMDEYVIFKSMPFPAAVGPLSSEIQMLYLTYLQSGGSDHNIFRQMYELQLEATALEKVGPKLEHRARKKKHEGCPSSNSKTLDAELLSVELENQRLEDEILKQKILKDRRRMESGSLDSELAKLQQIHMAEIAQVQAEIGRLRHDTERKKLQWPRRRSPPHLPPAPPPPLGLSDPTVLPSIRDAMGSSAIATNQYFLDPSEALGPAPYDPVSGFVIFYDFLLGLDPMFYHVCLVSGLYRDGQQLGKSTPLPVVSSDMGQSPQFLMDKQRGCCAILAAQQPVPRILPSTSITLIVEFRASGGFDVYGQEIQNMTSRGWAKINVFDSLHQVMSGHWKVPIRVLPMKPSLTEEQLNGVPQAGKAELYLRLVNSRDADMQSMAEIQPGNASLYKYPPTVIRTRDSGLNYCTDFVRSDITLGYFVYGEQQVIFRDVMPQEDMILVARFYHWQNGRTPVSWDKDLNPCRQQLLGSEQWLVAWAVLSLTKQSESCEIMFAGAVKKGESRMPMWNLGTHTLPLYQSPVPSVASLPMMSAEQKQQDFKLYDATLTLRIFSIQSPELPFPPDLPVTLESAET